LDELLLSRVEDAGLNASAPPQQRWLDGWLLRFSPGKAKRARCVNAVAAGRLPLAQKLALAEQAFREADLPMVVRITRFTQPAGLDAELAARGFETADNTRVMVCPHLAEPLPPALPAGTQWVSLPPLEYAEAVGALRGSPPLQRSAHAERLRHSPVPYHGFAIRRVDDHQVLACGQFAIEADLVGLYDVVTAEPARGQGLASGLCRRLLALAVARGARVGYLQVEADNAPARAIYHRLGFADGYAYHYRQAPVAAA
jgi:ribosomal protein S18 acetylase RimI-like enzyme